MLQKIPMARFGLVEEIVSMVWLAMHRGRLFSTGAVFDLSGGGDLQRRAVKSTSARRTRSVGIAHPLPLLKGQGGFQASRSAALR
jgi:hypothetical protein